MRTNKLSTRGIFERPILEEDVVGQCRTLLELNGARVFRAIERVPKCYRCGCWFGSSERGTPDVSGYLRTNPVIPFWIEFKRPKGKKRESQIERINGIREDGGIALFADSLEAMVRGFAEFGVHLKGFKFQ